MHKKILATYKFKRRCIFIFVFLPGNTNFIATASISDEYIIKLDVSHFGQLSISIAIASATDLESSFSTTNVPTSEYPVLICTQRKKVTKHIK